MARDFFKNLPDTTTPISASRLNALLDGDEPMGNVVVDTIRNKNMLNLNQSEKLLCVLNSNGSITSSFTNQYYCTIKANYLRSIILANKGKTITFSMNEAISGKFMSIVLYGTRTGGETYQEINGNSSERYVSGTIASDFTAITSVELRFNRSSSAFTDTTTTRNSFMLELNTTTPTIYKTHQVIDTNEIIEQGAWTPSLGNANCTYNAQNGNYIRIGNLVYAYFNIRGTINSVDSSAQAFINGLPYTSYGQQAGSLYEYSGCFSDDSIPRLLRIVGNQIGIQSGNSGGAAVSYWDAGHGTFYISGSATYIKG